MRERDKDEIRHLIDIIYRAYIDQDLEQLRETHVAAWCGFRSRSTAILRSLDAYLNEAAQDQDDWQYLDYEMVEIDYLFHDSLCLVPHIARLRRRSKAGHISEIKLCSLAVFKQENEGWRQISSQTARYPEPHP